MTSKRLVKGVLRVLGGFFIILLLYLCCYFLVPHCGNGCSGSAPKDYIEIYLVNSGVHTDVVVPWNDGAKNWGETFPQNQPQDSNLTYLALGWGHKKFYMETPTWNDLTVANALSATFGVGETALHVRNIPRPFCGEPNRCIWISNQDYANLCRYIERSAKAEIQPAKVIEQLMYPHDKYYEATGHYHALRTCNTWVADALLAANQKGPIWTASPQGLMQP